MASPGMKLVWEDSFLVWDSNQLVIQFNRLSNKKVIYIFQVYFINFLESFLGCNNLTYITMLVLKANIINEYKE